jgi:hypothetical protein
MKKTLLFLGCFCLLTGVPLRHGAAVDSSTQTFSPSADTFLNLNNTAGGASPSLYVFTWPDNKIANVVLMKFDLTSIPLGSVIESAALHVSLLGGDGTPETDHSVSVHKVINKNPDLAKATGMTYDGALGWTASDCCFSGIPLAQNDISGAYDTKVINKTAEFKTWNVAALVQEWVNSPGTNYGLLLKGDVTQTMNHYRIFASLEYPDSQLRPFLQVVYRRSDSLPSPPRRFRFKS